MVEEFFLQEQKVTRDLTPRKPETLLLEPFMLSTLSRWHQGGEQHLQIAEVLGHRAPKHNNYCTSPYPRWRRASSSNSIVHPCSTFRFLLPCA